MPVTIVTGQPGCIQAHDKTGFAETNLRDQPLKAVSVIAGGRRLAQVVVDDVNTLARPTQQDSPLNQAIFKRYCSSVLS
jgi:hypothetical protein